MYESVAPLIENTARPDGHFPLRFMIYLCILLVELTFKCPKRVHIDDSICATGDGEEYIGVHRRTYSNES